MLRKARNLAAFAALPVVAVLLSGCIQAGQDLVEADRLSLEKVKAKGVRVMWAEVRQDGETAVVTGSLLPRGPAFRRYAGQVVVELISADGKVVGKGRSRTLYLCQRGPGRTPGMTHFMVYVQAAAPEGGKVRVGFSHGT